MKYRKLNPAVCCLAALLMLCGCHNELESEIDNLNRRIENLQQRCATMNVNITALQTVLEQIESYDFVSDVNPITEAGSVIGYTITFTHSGDISIFFGEDADTPIVGVQLDEDGIYYWTVTYSDGKTDYIYDDYGQKRAATAYTPQIEIRDGDWWVSYDGGTTWSDLGRATGNPGTSYFSNVAASDDYVVFTLLDGTQITVPTWTAYQKLQAALEECSTNLASFKVAFTAFQNKKYVAAYGKATDGKRIWLELSDGTRITFYNSTSSTSTSVPLFKACCDPENPDDTALYWSVKYPGSDDYTWVLCNGEKVRADAVVLYDPVIGFERDTDNIYYWTVSYDNGETCEWILKDGEKVMAQAPDTSNPVTSVVQDIDGRYLKITVNGEEVMLPQFKDIEIEIETSLIMGEDETRTISYNIPEGDSQTALTIIPSTDGFTATISRTNCKSGKITIKAPSDFSSGAVSTLTLLVSDGRGTLKTVNITITYGIDI